MQVAWGNTGGYKNTNHGKMAAVAYMAKGMRSISSMVETRSSHTTLSHTFLHTARPARFPVCPICRDPSWRLILVLILV